MRPGSIWCVTDGLAGHRSQLLGLADALHRHCGASVVWLTPGTPVPETPPWLILAAGRRTHWRALKLRHRYDGRLAVLMRPGLPRCLFDLCILPEHDGIPEGPRTWLTRGPLNPVIAQPELDSDNGLILLGGPSRHHSWSPGDLEEQLRRLRKALPGVCWTVGTSRRTPDATLTMLATLEDNTFRIMPAQAAPPGWLLSRFQQCGIIWVTEDSAAMVYEALSSGARVGVLKVPRRRSSRVSRGLDALVEAGSLSTLPQLVAQGDMPRAAPPLQEADRIAARLIDHFA